MDESTIPSFDSESASSAENETAEPTQPVLKRRNERLLATLARIAIIHERMKGSSGERTEEYLREARDGGMYGSGG